ncbi:MAG: phosphohistidine phosphatase SixA [Cyanobacteriota bacterium]|nr:phosphohistidine phosphatase SixA [Cyanobacteriota bacterium]
MAEVELILLRHGLAQPHGSVDDPLRALTPEGRQRTLRVCQRACQLGLKAPALISSPLVRARQTAEVAVEAGLAPALTCDEALAPGGDPWPLLHRWWTGERDAVAAKLILVGHEPDLGRLASRLIGAPPGAVVLKKAGIAVLAWGESVPAPANTNPGQLRLLLSPKVLGAV